MRIIEIVCSIKNGKHSNRTKHTDTKYHFVNGILCQTRVTEALWIAHRSRGGSRQRQQGGLALPNTKVLFR